MKRSVGDLLVWAGAAIGVGGAVLVAIGAWVHLPPALVILIAKALPFVVAAALLAIGAIVRRSALRAPPPPPPSLGGGQPPAGDVAASTPVRAEVRR